MVRTLANAELPECPARPATSRRRAKNRGCRRRLIWAAATLVNWPSDPSASLFRLAEPSSAIHLDLDQGEAVRLALVLPWPTLQSGLEAW
jgi:hypothetical protein